MFFVAFKFCIEYRLTTMIIATILNFLSIILWAIKVKSLDDYGVITLLAITLIIRLFSIEIYAIDFTNILQIKSWYLSLSVMIQSLWIQLTRIFYKLKFCGLRIGNLCNSKKCPQFCA